MFLDTLLVQGPLVYKTVVLFQAHTYTLSAPKKRCVKLVNFEVSDKPTDSEIDLSKCKMQVVGEIQL